MLTWDRAITIAMMIEAVEIEMVMQNRVIEGTEYIWGLRRPEKIGPNYGPPRLPGPLRQLCPLHLLSEFSLFLFHFVFFFFRLDHSLLLS